MNTNPEPTQSADSDQHPPFARYEADDWKMLHQLSMGLLQPGRLGQKLNMVLETVAAFHNTTKAVLSVMNVASSTLTVKASMGFNDAAVRDLSRIRPGEGCCGVAFAERHRVIIENFASCEQFKSFRPWAELNGIGGVYSTPFNDAENNTIGVLTLYFDHPHSPTIREMELTDMCASSLALMLDRERTEAARRRERDHRDQVFGGMAEALCIVDRDFTVIEMNAAAVQLNKRPLHEMLGRSHWDLWPETNDSEVGRLYRKAMAARVTTFLENRWVDPVGNVGWYELTAQPIAEGLALYIRDISKRKAAEEEMRQSEMRYRILSETVSDLVWRANAHGKPIEDTSSWRRYTGDMTPDLQWITSVHPDDRERVKSAWQGYLAKGEPAGETYRVRRKDGEYRYLHSRAVPLRNSLGEVVEWIGICTDVTDVIMESESMRLANARKDQFLAILSHELRNPISATRMAASLLEKPAVEEHRVAHLAQVIGRQVGHMSRLVEDLLDVSRVSLGYVILDKQQFDLRAIAHDAVEQVRPMFTLKHQILIENLPTQECAVFVDRTRMVQVVANLLSNAARYTPDRGNISVNITALENAFDVRVTDNGIGFEQENVKGLFDFYAQAERSADRKNGGLGLGLALVKSLVELHGGSVHAYSNGKDLGSTFTVRLPRR
ncbi:PAS domain-containing protein [Noviherbaspirillum sp. L7-7A]|uniref:sensor histidine kinase n=1 Tax=Noviherbaspirillum sp. L7-7A TaxID=2850560 RepID=UPI001C2C0FC4|nr:PAS domain-containing protein [Noviherbaspirillum sp. L7-7A]MBV0882178.1 PAS domain-containing protein [Noviherbaspirillum sp. L7-7A]